jgi:polyhydroxyalkanoate synthase
VVEDIVRRNVLMDGTWELGGREIEFTRTDASVLNVIASHDKVVPRAASEPAGRVVGRAGRRDELIVKGGHATFGTGRAAFTKTLPSIADWIRTHSNDQGDPHGDQTART